MIFLLIFQGSTCDFRQIFDDFPQTLGMTLENLFGGLTNKNIGMWDDFPWILDEISTCEK